MGRRVQLHVHSSSPSTTCYTVSNAAWPQSRLTKAICSIALALKCFATVVCATIVVLQCKHHWGVIEPFGKGQMRDMEQVLAVLITQGLGAKYAAAGSLWWMVPAASTALIWVALRRDYIEESLLLVRGLGLQTTSSSSSYLSKPTTRFISTSQIQDIFIHEAFVGFEVKFYLAVVVEGETEAVVVFPRLLPRREILEEIWRGSRAALGLNKGLDSTI